jgi:hypothetical protein
VATNWSDVESRNFDFISVTQPSQKTVSNAKSEEARTRDELRTVIRRRVMATYLREKRQNSNKQKPPTQSESPGLATKRHAIGIAPHDNSTDPFSTAPIKLEAYMYDLLQFCEYSLSSLSPTSNLGLIATLYRLHIRLQNTLLN